MTPAPTPSSMSPKPTATSPRIERLALVEFLRSLTLGSSKWVHRMEREVRAGNRQALELLEGYRHVLPQSLLEAVLAARVVSPQVRNDVEVVSQTRPRVNISETLKNWLGFDDESVQRTGQIDGDLNP